MASSSSKLENTLEALHFPVATRASIRDAILRLRSHDDELRKRETEIHIDALLQRLEQTDISLAKIRKENEQLRAEIARMRDAEPLRVESPPPELEEVEPPPPLCTTCNASQVRVMHTHESGFVITCQLCE